MCALLCCVYGVGVDVGVVGAVLVVALLVVVVASAFVVVGCGRVSSRYCVLRCVYHVSSRWQRRRRRWC